MTPIKPPLQSARLPDQVRERIAYLEYSQSTGKVHLYWVGYALGGLKHPRHIGVPQVEAFLPHAGCAIEKYTAHCIFIHAVESCGGCHVYRHTPI